MKIGAIVLVAGSGSRMNAGFNKTLLALGPKGTTIAELVLRQFCLAQNIDQVILVTKPEEAQAMKALVPGGFESKVSMALGGKERMHSVANGLSMLRPEITHVLVQDGARPFVDQALIDRVVAALKNHRAVIPALPSKDTLKEVHHHRVKGTLPRDHVYRVQTPQGFERGLFEHMQAHVLAEKESDLVHGNKLKPKLGGTFTDDASIAEALGYNVHVVLGSEWNIKLTTPEDMVLGEGIYTHLSKEGALK